MRIEHWWASVSTPTLIADWEIGDHLVRLPSEARPQIQECGPFLTKASENAQKTRVTGAPQQTAAIRFSCLLLPAWLFFLGAFAPVSHGAEFSSDQWLSVKKWRLEVTLTIAAAQPINRQNPTTEGETKIDRTFEGMMNLEDGGPFMTTRVGTDPKVPQTLADAAAMQKAFQENLHRFHSWNGPQGKFPLTVSVNDSQIITVRAPEEGIDQHQADETAEHWKGTLPARLLKIVTLSIDAENKTYDLDFTPLLWPGDKKLHHTFAGSHTSTSQKGGAKKFEPADEYLDVAAEWNDGAPPVKITDHPLAGDGQSLSGSLELPFKLPSDRSEPTGNISHRQMLLASSGTKPMTATFTWKLYPAPPSELELVVDIPHYADWLPMGGIDEKTPGPQPLTVGVSLRQKDDGKLAQEKIAQVTFELNKTSRETGVCLNWPGKQVAQTDYDLQFIASAKLALNNPDGQSATAANPPAKFDVTVGCFDYGAHAELKVTATLANGKVITGYLKGQSEGADILIPKRVPGSAVALAWQISNGNQSRSDNLDDDAAPAAAKTKGDNLTFYDEYRGVMTKSGYRRLDPNRMDLFVLDPDALLDVALWRKITGSNAILLDANQHDGQRVDFNSSNVIPVYAVRIQKVTGVIDPLNTAPHTGIWGQTVGVVATDVVTSRIFVDRPGYGLTTVLHQAVKAALANPNSPDGVMLYGQGFTLPMLGQADAALANTALVNQQVAKLIRYVTIHELCHACDIDHHGRTEPQSTAGALNCVIRNFTDTEKYYGMVQELLAPTSNSLPFGIDQLCTTAPDDSWSHFRLKK